MVVNSFHARSGSTAQLDTGDVHVCHICLKQFSRRDLRERHRRRCEKSIGKIIPTKKRSCERCISFKVKCDYEKPSCSRCLNRSVPCEYKLEPRVKVPLNPAFSLGPNTTFSGSLDVFSVADCQNSEMSNNNISSNAAFDPHQQRQQRQHQHQHHRQQASALTAPEMVFDLSSSTASTDASSIDAALDLATSQVYYTVGNECYQQHWGPQHGGGSGSGSSSSRSHGSQWDATTVWSDASSGLVDQVMLDDAVMEPSWATTLLDPTVCMDAYNDANGMLYSQDFQQQPIMAHGRSGKHFGKSASLSY